MSPGVRSAPPTPNARVPPLWTASDSWAGSVAGPVTFSTPPLPIVSDEAVNEPARWLRPSTVTDVAVRVPAVPEPLPSTITDSAVKASA